MAQTIGMILSAICTILCCFIMLFQDDSEKNIGVIVKWAGMSIVSALIFCVFLVLNWVF